MNKVELPDEINDVWNSYTSPPVQHIQTPEGHPSLSILRLDQIDSWASGNKYFKLKYALRLALSRGVTTIVSKGGMFSNHLAALSQACSVFGLHLVNVIRSHQPDETNPSILQLRAHGDEILYVSPEVFAAFDETESAKRFPEAMFIPEGGLSEEGILGTQEIAAECIHHSPTHVIVAAGTMGTAMGLLAAMPGDINVIVVPAWKGCTNDYVQQVLTRYSILPACAWQLWPDYHFGGFGKFDPGLIDFMTSFTRETAIPLDPVYTGKMMFAIKDKMDKGDFSSGDRILAIHTGGLQGLKGYNYLYPEQWKAYVGLVG